MDVPTDSAVQQCGYGFRLTYQFYKLNEYLAQRIVFYNADGGGMWDHNFTRKPSEASNKDSGKSSLPLECSVSFSVWQVRACTCIRNSGNTLVVSPGQRTKNI